MSEQKKQNKHLNENVNNNNEISKDRKEWSKEWGLQQQTEGLEPEAVAKQHKIADDLKRNSIHHPKKS